MTPGTSQLRPVRPSTSCPRRSGRHSGTGRATGPRRSSARGSSTAPTASTHLLVPANAYYRDDPRAVPRPRDRPRRGRRAGPLRRRGPPLPPHLRAGRRGGRAAACCGRSGPRTAPSRGSSRTEPFAPPGYRGVVRHGWRVFAVTTAARDRRVRRLRPAGAGPAGDQPVGPLHRRRRQPGHRAAAWHCRMPDCTARPSDCDEIRLINQLDGFDLDPRVSIRFAGPIDVRRVTSATVYVHRVGDTSTGRAHRPRPAGRGRARRCTASPRRCSVRPPATRSW